MLGWGSWTNECEERGLESGSILAMKRRIDKVFYPSEAGMQLGGVRVHEEDIPKVVLRVWYGHFDLTIMLLGIMKEPKVLKYKWMSLVESRDEIPLRRGDCDNRGLSRVAYTFRL
ncbi:hypothetical protein Tco_1219410 [Tanacetum coccineum]